MRGKFLKIKEKKNPKIKGTLRVHITHERSHEVERNFYSSKAEMISRFPPSPFQIMHLKRPMTHNRFGASALLLIPPVGKAV